ncbi:hypothetical protein NTJ56_08650 [Burkholderia contaminans]|uniref:hypothetical protein n=1 Tax=Burkholderia contaminans TaxID=488447 RepID=UPI00215060CE|nr:hypothetical protein [Burkholderia contaminans]UUX38855.1 hypothetical protein NTJ56_08650 [Burkholderia contaminans]
MNEIKHTPGPWILETVPTSVGSCHKIGRFPGAGHRPHTYACVYADGIRPGIDDALPAAIELAANARLMAAAPDMADVLEMIAADDDAARKLGMQPLLTSAVRTALDAALIKAGRKAAPEPVRHVTIAGGAL